MGFQGINLAPKASSALRRLGASLGVLQREAQAGPVSTSYCWHCIATWAASPWAVGCRWVLLSPPSHSSPGLRKLTVGEGDQFQAHCARPKIRLVGDMASPRMKTQEKVPGPGTQCSSAALFPEGRPPMVCRFLHLSLELLEVSLFSIPVAG